MSLEQLDEEQDYGHYPPPLDIEIPDDLRDFLPDISIRDSEDTGFEIIDDECIRGFAYPNLVGGRTEIISISPHCRDENPPPPPPPMPPLPDSPPLSLPPPKEGCTVTGINAHYIKRVLLPSGNVDPDIPPEYHNGMAPLINFSISDKLIFISAPGTTEKIDLLSLLMIENDGVPTEQSLGPWRDTFFLSFSGGFMYRQIFHFWLREQHFEPNTYFYTDSNYNLGWHFESQISGTLVGFLEWCGDAYPRKPRKRFPPPPIKDCRCMCDCSPRNQRKNETDNDELKRMLRLILNRIGKPTEATIFDVNTGQKGAQSKKVKFGSLFDAMRINVWRTEVTNASLGIDAFPIDAPSTTILPEKSGIFGELFKHLNPEKRQRIDSLAELILWIEEQNSTRDGQWMQSIAITDQGKPTDTIVLSDAASTLKEIFILIHGIASSMNLLTDISMKALTEASSARTEAAKAWIVSRDIQEYLDYPTRELTHDIPIGISPFKYSRSGPNDPLQIEKQDDIERLLQPGSAKIKSDEWTGERSLNDVLIEILQMAATIRAAFYQRT